MGILLVSHAASRILSSGLQLRPLTVEHAVSFLSAGVQEDSWVVFTSDGVGSFLAARSHHFPSSSGVSTNLPGLLLSKQIKHIP